jgi:hypothetical protein
MTSHLHDGCPVVLAAVRRATFLPLWLFVSDQEALWADIEERARASRPDDTAVRLRMFYSLELLYTQAIPRQVFLSASLAPVTQKLTLSSYLKPMYPRTNAGLVALQQDAVRLRLRLSGLAGSAVLLQNHEDTSLQWVAVYDTLRTLLGAVTTTVDAISGCLRRNDVQQAAHVGTLLMQSFYDSHLTKAEIEVELHALLNVTSFNAGAPWQKNVKNPSSPS